MDNRNLTPDQFAVLSEALELLDEVQTRLICGDNHTALMLLRDLRKAIESVRPGDRSDTLSPVSPLH